mmetsp:Transcript_3766/g.5591  ORF Transcript_3766/g.5591 Transcript_3766/m.5591 type:complete len:227 (+) Transcript_3766:469-1149(+)
MAISFSVRIPLTISIFSTPLTMFPSVIFCSSTPLAILTSAMLTIIFVSISSSRISTVTAIIRSSSVYPLTGTIISIVVSITAMIVKSIAISIVPIVLSSSPTLRVSIPRTISTSPSTPISIITPPGRRSSPTVPSSSGSWTTRSSRAMRRRAIRWTHRRWRAHLTICTMCHITLVNLPHPESCPMVYSASLPIYFLVLHFITCFIDTLWIFKLQKRISSRFPVRLV